METIIHNGEKYCKLTDLLEEIGYMCAAAAEKPQEGPFDPQKSGIPYFFIGPDGAVDCDSVYDSDLYAVANYCADKEMMKQRALHETLNRLLWRYSEQHGGDPEWCGYTSHWCIASDEQTGKVKLWYERIHKHQGTVYFGNREIAEQAIKEIVEPFMAQHPEFVW